MTPDTAKVEELIALSMRLASIIESDVAVLRNKRPSMLSTTEAERSMAMLRYSKAVAEFKASSARKTLPQSALQRLRAATTRLNASMKEQNTLLIRFRHVTEGLIKAVADVVIARETPNVYAKSGAMSKSYATGRSAALTLNQAV